MDNSSDNIDQQLLKAYQETVYQVLEPPLSIQIGVLSADLNTFLQENDATTWAFITAWNPKSQRLSQKENKRRHKELIKMVKNAGYLYFIGKGMGKNADWEPEMSLLILNIPIINAIQIGKYFNQNAIVFGAYGDVPILVIIPYP